MLFTEVDSSVFRYLVEGIASRRKIGALRRPDAHALHRRDAYTSQRKGGLTILRSSSGQQLGASLARSLEYLAYSDCRLGMVHRFRHFSLRGILGSAADCICLWALHLQVSYGSLDPRLFVRVQLIVLFRSTPDACAL